MQKKKKNETGLLKHSAGNINLIFLCLKFSWKLGKFAT